jgi:protein TonB
MVKAPLLRVSPELIRAPLQTSSRRRTRLVVGVAASLLAHAALAALVWRTPAPAPQPGFVEMTVVYAGEEMESPAGEISIPLETAPPDSLARELVAPQADSAQEQTAPAPQQVLAMLQPPQEPVAATPIAAEPVVVKPASKPKPKPKAQSRPPAAEARTEGRALAASRGAQTAAQAPPHYLMAVFARVQQAKRYPARAQARGDQGRAVVSISIQRNGALAGARLVRSSGSALLDEAAMATVRRAAPCPAVPPEFGGATLVVNAPMNFTIE